MATRSNIGIVNNDGSIETIYCHWDGYPEHVGVVLAKWYREAEVRTLLGLGDRSSLHVEPTVKDSYAERGEVCKSQTYASIYEYAKADKAGAEFVYLFKDGEWHVYETINPPYIQKENGEWEKDGEYAISPKGIIDEIDVKFKKVAVSA